MTHGVTYGVLRLQDNLLLGVDSLVVFCRPCNWTHERGTAVLHTLCNVGTNTTLGVQKLDSDSAGVEITPTETNIERESEQMVASQANNK